MIVCVLIAGLSAAQAQPLPLGISKVLYELSVPSEKIPSKEKIALGEKLFNDPRLSADNTIACATCHDPNKAFTDGKAVSEGIKKQKTTRNSPTVLNAMFNATQFWDGRAKDLEEQAGLPIINAIEMGMSDEAEVVEKLRGIPEYVAEFQAVFGAELDFANVRAAIAAFERTQASGNSPFDKFIFGDAKAISAGAKRGWALFNSKGRCNSCHGGNAIASLFSDQKFHNIGIAAQKQDFGQLAREALTIVRTGDQRQIDELALQTKFSELGRFLVTKNENDIGAFKTPAIRNAGLTAPYMHDGSLATLWDVLDHYNKGGTNNPYLDGGIIELGLSGAEVDDLVELLFSMSDERFAALNKAERARQTARKKGRR